MAKKFSAFKGNVNKLPFGGKEEKGVKKEVKKDTENDKAKDTKKGPLRKQKSASGMPRMQS